MSDLQTKYKSVADAAAQAGVTDLLVREQDNILYIDGTAPSEAAKKQVWDAYNTVDPDYRSGDLVLNLTVAAGAATSSTYEVKGGDTLSKIAKGYGLTWQEVFEANKDKISDPDKIFPGQVLTIPAK
ncbi:MAG: LysM peptidoglycan-binding domain-containing protein [Edaphocola sp.]